MIYTYHQIAQAKKEFAFYREYFVPSDFQIAMKDTSLILLLVFGTVACSMEKNPPTEVISITEDEKASLEVATFGAGCFWCVEAVFERLNGVYEVKSGYMGGHNKNPTYKDICTGKTGHAEVIRIHFDPETISFETLLDWLWRSHDPTTLNRQGHDIGTQYRSAIFYHNEAQKKAALLSKATAQTLFESPIVTEITPASTYYPAENYHQDYFRLNPDNPYCARMIAPKLKQLNLN